jgi:ABC-type transport system involved in cytochrome c biogenesis permease subunit
MQKLARYVSVALLVIAPLVGGARVRARDHPAWPLQAVRAIRPLAIQHNGRQKPFDSFARETLTLLTGASQVGHEDPVQTVVSVVAEPERWQDAPLIVVPFIPLREPLGLDRTRTHISYNDLVATRKLMRMLPPLVEKQERNEPLSMLEHETMDVFQRFAALSNLFEQKLNLVPPASAIERVWLPILQPAGYPRERQEALRGAWTALITAAREGPPQAINAAARELVETLQAVNPAAYPARWRLRLEVFYNRAAPFRIAQLLYLVAFCGVVLGVSGAHRRLAAIGLLALRVAFLVHGAGIVVRVVLGERAPVSNFFETMLWLPFVAVALALIFEQVSRARPSTRPAEGRGSLKRAPSEVEGRYIGMAAALLATLILVLADHVPLDSSISPVVAVLRSNLWLTTHVLTIVASYGALALATALAHIYGWLYLFRPGEHPLLAALDTFLYRAIQVGVVLLAGGIMLGAVWANASWGRYWGWDPKETWALITLLWFIAILHGRFAGWLRGIGVALSTVGGFLLLLMTYYGVSFYLVGLHSYAGGHAKPLPSILLAYLIAEVVLLLTVGLTAVSRRRAAS